MVKSAQYRLLATLSEKETRLSNLMPLVDATLLAQAYRKAGVCVEVVPDSRSLRTRMQLIDEQIRELGKTIPQGPRDVLAIVAWDGRGVPPPCCSCSQCRQSPVPVFHQAAPLYVPGPPDEHPEFAPPPLKHGFATLEDDEPEPLVNKRKAPSGKPLSLAAKRREAWGMFVRGARRWSWRWPLLIPATFVLLVLASCVSLALEAFAWFVAKEPSL